MPNDPQSPFVTSGLRIGTPAATTRGFKEEEITLVATWICDVLEDINNEQVIEEVKLKLLNFVLDFQYIQINLCIVLTVVFQIQRLSIQD